MHKPETGHIYIYFFPLIILTYSCEASQLWSEELRYIQAGQEIFLRCVTHLAS